MYFLKSVFKGISWWQFIVLSILSAAIGVPVVAFITKLAENNGELFFTNFEINISIAKVVIFLILIFIIFVTVNNIIVKRRELKINEAKYGVSGSYVDITPEINEFISNNKLNMIVSNGITGGFDPKPYVHKHAIIKYKYGNKEYKITVSEGDRAILPTGK